MGQNSVAIELATIGRLVTVAIRGSDENVGQALPMSCPL